MGHVSTAAYGRAFPRLSCFLICILQALDRPLRLSPLLAKNLQYTLYSDLHFGGRDSGIDSGLMSRPPYTDERTLYGWTYLLRHLATQLLDASSTHVDCFHLAYRSNKSGFTNERYASRRHVFHIFLFSSLAQRTEHE